jgi:outer membrane protein assembly factor BamB
VQTSTGELQLLTADGDVVRDQLGGHDGGASVLRVDDAGRYLLERGGPELSVVVLSSDLDPGKDRTLQGGLVRPGLDDGSEPDLVLTADTTLHAWDADTGTQRWSSTEITPASSGIQPPAVLVIRGRVYVLSPAGLVALDAGTGKTLWHVAPDKTVPLALMTDAHHVVVGYESPYGGGEPQLVAYTFGNGTEVARFPYPEGIDHIQNRDGTLVGYVRNLREIAELS